MDLQPSAVPEAKTAIRMVYPGSRGGIPQCRQLAPCQHLYNCLCEICREFRMFCIFYNALFCMLQWSFINRRQVVALHWIALHRIELHCISSHRIVLYCIVLYCIVLYCIVLYCIVLYCIVLYCIVLYCIVLYCIVLAVRSLAVVSQPRQS